MEEENKKIVNIEILNKNSNDDLSDKEIRTRKAHFYKRSVLKQRTFISTKWRWIIMLVIGMTGFGPYFGIYKISSFSMELSAKLFGENFKYNILDPISSLGSIIASIVAGILISKKKLKCSIIFFSIMFIISQIIFTIVGYLNDIQDKSFPKSVFPYFLTFIGYSLSGIGIDGSQVGWMSMIGMWFEKQEISTGFGINLSVLRMSTILNLIIALVNIQLGPTFLIGLGLCILSLVFGIISIKINAYSKKIDIKRKLYHEEDEEQEFYWKNMFKFRLSFWILGINCATFYSSLFAFNFFSADLIDKKYKVKVRFLPQYVFLSGILMSPILGYITDLYGNKIYSLVISSILLIIAHLLNVIPNITDYWGLVPLILMAISYSLYYVTFWPSISLIVNYEMIGCAYGVGNSIQNLGLVIFPFVSSFFIQDNETQNKYQYIEIILLIFAIFTLISSLILWRVDKKKYRGILQNPCMKIIKQPSNSFGITKESGRSFLSSQENSSFLH